LGIQLQQALNQPGKERIKDLVRNPLRLMLLCSTWHLREGKLPDTKAELYQQFVDEVYRWQDKEKEVSTITPEEREQLNAKLKQLAVAAIDNEKNRFCLRQKFVEGVFGDSSLFQLALNVGWLNQVGVDAKNTHQPVYAFFHPTFQEYFAALAIADWDFFLPRAHDSHNPKPVSERYRIFEPQWKEVILLWLGREEVAKEEREAFIKALVEFEDGCGGFYWYKSFFSATASVAEFSNCTLTESIVAQIVWWAFGYFSNELKLPRKLALKVSDKAKAVMQESERTRIIAALMMLLISQNQDIKCQAAISLLLKYKQDNLEALTTLNYLLDSESDNWIVVAAAVGLFEYFKYDHNNPCVIKAATNLSQWWNVSWENNPGYFFRLVRNQSRGAFKTLYDIDICQDEEYCIRKETTIFGTFSYYNLRHNNTDNLEPNNDGINKLSRVLQNKRDEQACYQLSVQLEEKTDNLGLGRGNLVNLNAVKLIELVKQLCLHSDLASSWKLLSAAVTRMGEGSLGEIIFQRLREVTSDKPDVIDTLIEVVTKALINVVQECLCLQPEFYSTSVDYLGRIGVGNLDALNVLIEVVHSSDEQNTRIEAVRSLHRVLRGNLFHIAVIGLKSYLQEPTYVNAQPLYDDCYELIWHCAQNMTYPAFYQAWHQQEEVEKTTTSDRQSLNQADLLQSLQSAIANDPQLSQIIHLICIDGSQFIEPDRPAAEIYDQMLDQNCPECNPVPETMPALKLYWNSLKRKSDKRMVFVFYSSSTDTTPDEGTTMSCPYSSAFLTVLSKFGCEICIITEQPLDHIRLKFFAPSQVIADVTNWIRAIATSP
jgi:hypothetical protein